eukprot:8624780-Heterocapsa_arctica.AAC.1
MDGLTAPRDLRTAEHLGSRRCSNDDLAPAPRGRCIPVIMGWRSPGATTTTATTTTGDGNDRLAPP